MSILDDAKEIVHGSREEDYGDSLQNHRRIAAGWTEIVGKEITPRQVAQMMIWLKISRDVNNPKRDNMLDIAGYAEIADGFEDQYTERPSDRERDLHQNVGLDGGGT